jgi:hypothetical protein
MSVKYTYLGFEMVIVGQNSWTMDLAWSPEIRKIPTLPLPMGVAIATIVSNK